MNFHTLQNPNPVIPPTSETRVPLKVLVVEDSSDDCDLLLLELRRSNYDIVHERVETGEAMRSALSRQPWDVVVSDYSLPNFSAPAALAILKDMGVDLPFIIVSGSIGEDAAVESLKSGAHDFFLKDRPARLIPALERELREAKIRRDARSARIRIQENERRLSAMFNQAAVGIVQASLDGCVLSANQRFCDLLERPLEQLLGRRLTLWTHPEDTQTMGDAFARISKGERSFIRELRYVRPDGTTVWVSHTVTVVIGEQGEPANIVVMDQDITDRKRVEEELRLAVHARDEFLSIASHEFKTPITTLELQLGSVLKMPRRGDFLPAEDVQSKLSKALRQVDRLTGLINSLLDVTQITAGPVVLSRMKLDLRDVIHNTIARLGETIKRSGSPVKIHSELPVVGAWDPVALERIVWNLISNALKFGESKPIEIVVERREDHARLVVTDFGIGIPAAEQARIFQRFEKAVPSKHYGGFGMGLWVTSQLVVAHGGTIEVSSEKSAGTTFVVELPLQ